MRTNIWIVPTNLNINGVQKGREHLEPRQKAKKQQITRARIIKPPWWNRDNFAPLHYVKTVFFNVFASILFEPRSGKKCVTKWKKVNIFAFYICQQKHIFLIYILKGMIYQYPSNSYAEKVEKKENIFLLDWKPIETKILTWKIFFLFRPEKVKNRDHSQ